MRSWNWMLTALQLTWVELFRDKPQVWNCLINWLILRSVTKGHSLFECLSIFLLFAALQGANCFTCGIYSSLWQMCPQPQNLGKLHAARFWLVFVFLNHASLKLTSLLKTELFSLKGETKMFKVSETPYVFLTCWLKAKQYYTSECIHTHFTRKKPTAWFSTR